MKNEHYKLIRISVKITDFGKGLTMEQINKLCKRIEKISIGRAQSREVSAIC